jgi:ATP-binding protein involved in chromosome partitioning
MISTGKNGLAEAQIEAAIREVLTTPTSVDDTAISADDIAKIVIDDSWIGVVLRVKQISPEVLWALHRRLSTTFPGVTFELRAGGRVFRGGHGFGPGKHMVAVLGGKGGVGKSTTALNLALTFGAMGRNVGLVDGDFNAPDIPHMLDVHPEADPEGNRANWQLWSANAIAPSRRMRPFVRYGLEVMSTGFVIPEQRPPSPRSGAELSALLRLLTFDVAWSADLLLLDCPPGTGEELWSAIRELPLSGALFVTTPQDLAQMDAERTVTLLREHGVPIIGAIENMAFLQCPHCAEAIDLFPKSSRLARAGLDRIGRLPFDLTLSASADTGEPMVLAKSPGHVAREFAAIAVKVERWLRALEPPAYA